MLQLLSKYLNPLRLIPLQLWQYVTRRVYWANTKSTEEIRARFYGAVYLSLNLHIAIELISNSSVNYLTN